LEAPFSNKKVINQIDVRQTRKNTILIAEDNKDIREMLCVFLQSEGYDVLEAENGVEAVALAKSQRPDLIMMDLRMPLLNGLEAISEIRNLPDLKEIPILANSADGMYGVSLFTNIDELGGGFIEYAAKPLNLNALIDQIKNALQTAKLAA
jgi:CheY-like chemotaxis protein